MSSRRIFCWTTNSTSSSQTSGSPKCFDPERNFLVGGWEFNLKEGHVPPLLQWLEDPFWSTRYSASNPYSSFYGFQNKKMEITVLGFIFKIQTVIFMLVLFINPPFFIINISNLSNDNCYKIYTQRSNGYGLIFLFKNSVCVRYLTGKVCRLVWYSRLLGT